MSKELVFASANENKVKEVEQKMGGIVRLRGLKDIGCTDDIPETGTTLEDNARQKAWYIWDKYRVNCFADDTGLEVFALNNEPGVMSARYAGPQKNPQDNMDKLLKALENETNRTAQFRTVICLIIDGQEKLIEGVVKGTIARERSGLAGFGYDPIFIPEGHQVSFAEMTLEEKNAISHRGRAIKLLVDCLKSVD
ncbi:MAG TPA: non-canonical purine NTP diphosphatase [Flavobacteriales bacterium]